MRTNKYVAALFIGGTLLSGAAHAVTPVTETVIANLAFDSPLTITKISDINFGLLKAATAATYTIDTVGTVTTSGGMMLGGAPQAGNLTIAGSSTQVVNISVGNPQASNGVSLSAETCSYGGSAAAACNLTNQAAPGAGKTLLLGVTATADGSQVAGSTATPSFDVTVSYN